MRVYLHTCICTQIQLIQKRIWTKIQIFKYTEVNKYVCVSVSVYAYCLPATDRIGKAIIKPDKKKLSENDAEVNIKQLITFNNFTDANVICHWHVTRPEDKRAAHYTLFVIYIYVIIHAKICISWKCRNIATYNCYFYFY